MADIEIQGISKAYDQGRVKAVKDLTLTVNDGEFFVLLGPSGCGKTTVMRVIAGLETAERGSITIGQRDITWLPPRQRDIAMVFQNYAVFPHLTVFDNIGFGLKMKKTDRRTIEDRVQWAAGLVELDGLLDRRPSQLSGGQRQRVAVARAIAVEPSVLLMDEPLSNLDALLRLRFRSELKALVHELKTTTIYVTHDQIEALSLADRLAVMRDGEIVQCDTAMEVYERPASTFVGGFLGNPPMNFLPVVIEADGDQPRAVVGEYGFPVPEPLRKLAGRQVLAGIRGENVLADRAQTPGSIPGQTIVVEPLGSQLLVNLEIADHTIKVLTTADFEVVDHAVLWLRPIPEKICWFDPDTLLQLPIPA